MLCFPNAKINIGLHIIEKRPDGFHNIETIFYPIKWADVLEVVPANVGTTTSFTASGSKIPGNSADNLCLRAHSLLSKAFVLPPVQIYLHKLIPTGAGLGGGSSDAAFIISTLNNLFALGLSIAQQEDYARELGSDCAFFIENKPLYAFDKGDRFEDIALDLSAYTIAIVKPAIHVSTAAAYASVKPKKPVCSLKELVQEPIEQWKDSIHNDFETTVFQQYPAIGHIKNTLYQQGAVYAAMSGSGSAVYGIFRSMPELQFQDSAIFIQK